MASNMIKKIRKMRVTLRKNLKSKPEVDQMLQQIGILSGYRPFGISVMDSLVSVFVPMNETLNIATHGIPAVLMVHYTVYRVLHGPEFDDLMTSTFSWPLLMFLLTASFVLTASFLAHTFCSVSPTLYCILFACDYASIGFNCVTFVASIDAYVLPTDQSSTSLELLRQLYTPIGSLIATAFVIFGCWHCFDKQKRQSLFHRAAMMACLFLHVSWTILPALFKTAIFPSIAVNIQPNAESMHNYVLHVVLTIISGLAFGLHIPEVMYPGTFDIIGHSHQIMHVCVFLAAVCDVRALTPDLVHVKALARSADYAEHIQIKNTRLICMLLMPLINVGILAYFIRKILMLRKVSLTKKSN